MVRKALTLILAPLVVTLFLYGCGGSDDDTSTTSLTEGEAQAVAEVVADALGSVASAGTGGSPKLGPNFATFSQTIDSTINCEEGGTFDLSGSVSGDADENTGSSTSSYMVDQDFNSCASMTDNGDTVTVDGSIETSGTTSFTVSNNFETFSGTITSSTSGSLSVSGVEAGNGTCSVSIEITGTVSTDSVSIDYSGSICGQSISFSGTESLDDNDE